MQPTPLLRTDRLTHYHVLPHSRSSSSPLGAHQHNPLIRTASGLSMPNGIGSVEAWRAHTAGIYSQPSHQHATSLTQAALLRANGNSLGRMAGAGGGTDSAPGSDIHIEVPGSFRGSVAGAGIGLASSAASSSCHRALTFLRAFAIGRASHSNIIKLTSLNGCNKHLEFIIKFGEGCRVLSQLFKESVRLQASMNLVINSPSTGTSIA